MIRLIIREQRYGKIGDFTKKLRWKLARFKGIVRALRLYGKIYNYRMKDILSYRLYR